MRRSVAWLLSLPLTVLGAVLAHATAYRLVEPASGERAELLAETGHAYLALWPLLITAAVTVAVAGFLFCAFEGARGRGNANVPSWPLPVLPVAAFAVQEHLERLLHDGAFPSVLVVEPVFLVGLLLQLPFALAALVATRALGSAAYALGEALAAARPYRLTAPAVTPPVAAVAVPRLRPLAACAAGRGPPLA